MRIQHDTTLSMNLQVEVALPRDGEGEPQVVVWPVGGDGDPAGLTHRWSFSPEEAEQLANVLQDAAQRSRDMV